MDMGEWTMSRYNRDFTVPDNTPEEERYKKGYWTLTNGHMHFDIHPYINGSGSMGSTPLREPGPRHWIVSPDEAEAYAHEILSLLNKSRTHVVR